MVEWKKRDDGRCHLPEGLPPSGILQSKLKVDISVAQEAVQVAEMIGKGPRRVENGGGILPGHFLYPFAPHRPFFFVCAGAGGVNISDFRILKFLEKVRGNL